MKPMKIDKNKVVFADESLERKQQQQTKLAALADKKAKGKLTLEDLDAKLDIVIELLTESPK